MSGSIPVLKKPKLEVTEDEEEEEEQAINGNRREEEEGGNDDEQTTRQEQEEALLALTEHRAKEVEHLRNRITYYKSQVFTLSFSVSLYLASFSLRVFVFLC